MGCEDNGGQSLWFQLEDLTSIHVVAAFPCPPRDQQISVRAERCCVVASGYDRHLGREPLVCVNIVQDDVYPWAAAPDDEDISGWQDSCRVLLRLSRLSTPSRALIAANNALVISGL